MTSLEPHPGTTLSQYRIPAGEVSIDGLSAMAGFQKARSCMILGHPGHCLRVHGWMAAAKPLCHILTDGSGHSGASRLESSRKTMVSVGARAGSVYGRCTDIQIYTAILNGEYDLFTNLVDELASMLAEEGIDYVVGDAAEGYSTTHDVMRLVIDAAVARAEKIADREIPQYDFVLAAEPSSCPSDLRHLATWITLSDSAVESKLSAGANYPELAHEVSAALSQFGRDAFRIECLRPVGKGGAAWAPSQVGGERPYYETYGEKQVAAGKYHSVIRYAEHMAPLALALGRQG